MGSIANIGSLFYALDITPIVPTPTIGIIITGSPNVTANGTPVARTLDLGINSLGHGFVLIGTSTKMCNSRNVGKVGDQMTGPGNGVLLSGAATVVANS